MVYAGRANPRRDKASSGNRYAKVGGVDVSRSPGLAPQVRTGISVATIGIRIGPQVYRRFIGRPNHPTLDNPHCIIEQQEDSSGLLLLNLDQNAVDEGSGWNGEAEIGGRQVV